MGKPITIHKLDEKGVEVWKYYGTIRSKTPTSVTIEATFDRDEIQFQGIILRKGDRFLETFFSDRWYNIFEIYDVETKCLKGWYCNVCRPAQIEDSHVFADDLALDLIVYPDRRWLVVDEDEFAQLEISPEDKERAQEALEQLTHLVRKRMPPFDIL
jgi:predicted RNA-binding protein associated with RNAse of E/G family